jgi:hypothetical protein
MANSH